MTDFEQTLLTTHKDGNPLVSAMRKAGIKVIQYDFPKIPTYLPSCIGYYGNIFSEIKYPFAFMRLNRALARHGIPYIFWNRDAPWNVGMKLHSSLFLRLLKPVDIYLAHSMQDANWFTRGTPHYFPNAAQSDYCQPALSPNFSDGDQWRYDISFFGMIGNPKRTNCLRRKTFLDNVRKILERRGVTARWRVVDTAHEHLSVAQQLELIRSTRINLNFVAMCDLPGNSSWGMPERVFGIPAAGGFLLTDWRESIPKTFPDGSCDYFRTQEECADKIVYYLSHPDPLRRQAERLHSIVLDQHTYSVRAQHLIALLRQHTSQTTSLGMGRTRQ